MANFYGTKKTFVTMQHFGFNKTHSVLMRLLFGLNTGYSVYIAFPMVMDDTVD
jgi:hypothetical protein